MGDVNIVCGRARQKTYGVRAVAGFGEGRLLMGGVFHLLTLLRGGRRSSRGQASQGKASKVGGCLGCGRGW